MEIFLIKALQLIMALALLVILHEGGHFFFSKLFGVRVEKFFLFFDPWFHLVSTKDRWVRRLFGKKKPAVDKDEKEEFSGTEYGVGWLPLGGYVKIAGMIDESMDTEQMKQPEQPWEFRAKPAWQRLLIMVGGVLVNLLLAFFIYAMVLYTWGERYVPVQNWTLGMSFNGRAEEIGFRDGDVLLSTDKGPIDVRNIADLYRCISEAQNVTVKRGHIEFTLQMPSEMNLLTMIQEEPPFMEMLQPNVVDSVIPGTPGALAGLRPGDRLLVVNGVEVECYNDFRNEMERIQDQTLECSHADSIRLRHLTLVVEHQSVGQVSDSLRSAQRDTLSIFMAPDFTIGFIAQSPNYEAVQVEYGFWESFPAGVRYGWNVLGGYVSDLKYVFTKEGAKSLGGFAAIGSIFPSAWDWHRFWSMTAFLSIILAFMNILPIPALDGGHVLFLLYEVITRRKPSEKFLERAQTVGMVLLLILMVWANFNDVMRFLF